MSPGAWHAHGPAWDPAPPVAFTAVDELCCYFDSAAEPNNVHLEVQIPGHLDYARLREAAAAALAAAPRARGRRAAGSPLRASYTWQFPPRPDIDPLSSTTWSDEHDLARQRLAFLAASPQLDCSPPLRLLLAVGQESDCLILNAHHAAFDGISCLQLLRAIGARYVGADTAPGRPAARETSSVPAGGQARAAMTRVPAAAIAAGSSATARGPWHQQLRPHLPARIAADAGNGRRGGYGLRLISCSEVPAAQPGADRLATLNDLLIAALILTISRWNAAHGRRARQVRVSMPINARLGPAQENAPGNLSRIETVSAWPPHGAAQVRDLVFEVARQTRRAKQNAGPQVGTASRRLAATRCPVMLKRLITRAILRTIGPMQCDTAMLTNLGNVAEPPSFGPGGPVRMAFTAPAHMPRGLSVGAVTAGGQLQLCLRYRYALFDDRAASEFAGVYVAALSELSGRGPADCCRGPGQAVQDTARSRTSPDGQGGVRGA